MSKKSPLPTITVRIPEVLDTALDTVTLATGRTATEITVLALAEYLANHRDTLLVGAVEDAERVYKERMETIEIVRSLDVDELNLSLQALYTQQ